MRFGSIAIAIAISCCVDLLSNELRADWTQWTCSESRTRAQLVPPLRRADPLAIASGRSPVFRSASVESTRDSRAVERGSDKPQRPPHAPYPVYPLPASACARAFPLEAAGRRSALADRCSDPMRSDCDPRALTVTAVTRAAGDATASCRAAPRLSRDSSPRVALHAQQRRVDVEETTSRDERVIDQRSLRSYCLM